MKPKTTAIANWYGSNRMLADRVGAELEGCAWVGVPYAGGMCELMYISARTIGANDLHRHLINMARVWADPAKGWAFYRQLRRRVFHPDELQRAQEYCRGIEACGSNPDELFASGYSDPRYDPIDLEWAVNYFITSWMGRGGNSGTKREFKGGLPLRWDADGGGSAQRYFSAVASIPAWRRVLRRCEFSTLDAIEFIQTCKDKSGIGIYCDPPFPGPGDKYAHTMSDRDHRKLAETVSRFKTARVVMRFYDHPLIRELYPAPRWTWIEQAGRDQTNYDSKPEVLLINGPSLTEGDAA